MAASIFPREIFCPPKEWAEARWPNLFYWNELDKGGHFAAFEQPQLFAGEMRNAFNIFAPYRDVPKVTIFGSARTRRDDPLYVHTVQLAHGLAEGGWMILMRPTCAPANVDRSHARLRVGGAPDRVEHSLDHCAVVGEPLGRR